MVTPLKRIGLLGGSFNPAHEGHVYISEVALKTLGLDEIWWLVSPQNPLKEAATLKDYQERLQSAEEITSGKPIKVLDVEQQESLTYTIDTVRHLKSKFKDYAFVWLMGADCLANFHSWKSWREIFAEVAIAVFPRTGFSEPALSGPAATEFQKNRISEGEAQNLVVTTPPAWVYIDCKPVDISATEIRRGDKA